PLAGGTLVTILGTGFQTGASVQFGTAPGTSMMVVSATIITVKSPASGTPQTVSVTTTNPDTQSAALASAFTYIDGASFYTLTPCRIADTRNAAGPWGGPALSAAAVRSFVLAGRCGIPVTARAVALNVTVTQGASGPGLLTLYAGGTALPLASTIDY